MGDLHSGQSLDALRSTVSLSSIFTQDLQVLSVHTQAGTILDAGFAAATEGVDDDAAGLAGMAGRLGEADFCPDSILAASIRAARSAFSSLVSLGLFSGLSFFSIELMLKEGAAAGAGFKYESTAETGCRSKLLVTVCVYTDREVTDAAGETNFG